ncbi:transient receptor potential cation channel subfamily V member 5-like [Argonauta hians]
MGNLIHRPSRINDPVAAWKQQNREFPTHQIFTLVNFNNGGILVEAYNKGGTGKLVQALKEHVEPLLYNRGKGAIITKTEFLRWRYQLQVKMSDSNKAMPVKTDEELLSEYRDDKYQKFSEHEACWSLKNRGPLGETALHICFLLNTPVHIQIAHTMIELYPKLVLDVYEGTEYFGESSLHIAVVNGDLRSVRYLISKNVNVNQRATGNFFLPADQVGRRKKETDFKGLAHYGEYPIAFAACHERYEIYDYLTNYGANPNFQDSFGNTVLHMVVITNKVDFYKYAVKHMTIPGDTTRTNIYNLTPLALACKLGRPEIFHVMLELSAIELWRYSNITCSVYPIANLDTVDPDGITSWTSALNLIIDGETDEHLDMMEGKVIKQLLDEKWKTFAQVRFLCETLVCVSCVLVLSKTGKDLYQLGIRGFLKNSSHAPSKTIFVICCVLSLLCIPLRFSGLEGVEDFFMIIAVPGSWCVLLFFARGMVLTGPFVTMIYKMIVGDVFRFFIIYLIMVGAFAQAFFFLFRDIDDPCITTFRDLVTTIITLFQMTLGEFSYDNMARARYSELTKLLFIIFMILMPILLLNMLIAMMGNTYQSVINKAEIEWKKQWAKTISVLERSYTEKELREFQEEFSIPITKSGESGESSRPPRGLMVIKVSNKTRATQRKGALSNWKYYGKEIIKQVKEHMKKGMKQPMIINEMKKKMYIKNMNGKFVLAAEQKNVNLMSTLQSAAWSEDINIDKGQSSSVGLATIPEDKNANKTVKQKPNGTVAGNQTKAKIEPDSTPVYILGSEPNTFNEPITPVENSVKSMQPNAAPLLWKTRASGYSVFPKWEREDNQYRVTNIKDFKPLDIDKIMSGDKRSVDYSDTTSSSSPSLRSTSRSTLNSNSADSRKSRFSENKREHKYK